MPGKAPRISVLTVMAAAVVVALDCSAFRSIATRPSDLTREIWWIAVVSLPMANLLAIVAAKLLCRQGPGGHFLLGFAVAGLVAVVVSILVDDKVLDLLENFLTFLGLDAWIERSPVFQMIVIYLVVPAVFLIFQLAVAWFGGVFASQFRGIETIPGSDLPPNPRRLATLVTLVLLAAVPAVVIETYLRLNIDPNATRYAAGSLGVVDLHFDADFPLVLPAESPFAGLNGSRIRVESDTNSFAPWQFTLPSGRIYRRDNREVRVILLDGVRAGESISLPYEMIRPIP